MENTLVVLLILDGVGIAPNTTGNAVTKAPTPFLEKAWSSYPHTYLQASEEYVGLPPGVKGNSEVGHMNLGSGRVVYQDLPRINRSIQKGQFFQNQEFLEAINHANENKSKLHVAVCLSDGEVHGSINHLEAFIKTLSLHNFQQPVIVHAFTDGRDTPPKSAATYLKRTQEFLKKYKIGTIGTIGGRYYGMDRNQVWERIQKAYDLFTEGKGLEANTWQEALDQAYQRGETDEFIQPTQITSTSTPITIENNDAFVFLNFRSDRAVELTYAFIAPEFTYFKREKVPQNLFFVGMTQYAKGIPQHIAFPKENISLPLGRIIAEDGRRQLRIAESEKFPHVTYFFNGGRSIKFQAEDRVEVPSPDVATYDLKPEMSLPEVTRILLEKISLRIYNFILVNLANGDMVGHTGVFDAGLKAMQTVDKSVQHIVKATHSLGGTAIITADHGNIEEMTNLKTGETDTEHSINPVPFILATPKRITTREMLESGALSDVTPTILDIMGINKPEQITGKSLIR
ncbi:2,3-bisphosphoglycerate-independent phosphoglycerate mutase [Candidatus Dojkabacteria bacterium]|nr:2,3-bisphosphoglycerate-independent phosphoglycerate mutase [Candidatus Dojkabacteria bacterium]